MNGQISMFEMLGEPTTPVIPFEEQKKNRKGWIIEISGIFLQKNGFKENAIGVCTRPVVFEEDSKKDKYNRISQMARSIYGPPMGWCGGNKTVYAKRPTWEECVAYAHKHYSIPQTVKYYERNTNMENPVWSYEEGYKKGA